MVLNRNVTLANKTIVMRAWCIDRSVSLIQPCLTGSGFLLRILQDRPSIIKLFLPWLIAVFHNHDLARLLSYDCGGRQIDRDSTGLVFVSSTTLDPTRLGLRLIGTAGGVTPLRPGLRCGLVVFQIHVQLHKRFSGVHLRSISKLDRGSV